MRVETAIQTEFVHFSLGMVAVFKHLVFVPAFYSIYSWGHYDFRLKGQCFFGPEAQSKG